MTRRGRGEHRPVVRTPLLQMRFEREAPGQHVIHVGSGDFHHVAMLRRDEPAISVRHRSAEPFARIGVTRRICFAVMFDLPVAIKQNPDVVVLLLLARRAMRYHGASRRVPLARVGNRPA